MSERVYAWLLRLYPAGFRTRYQEEALQLYRERLRDEVGLFHRCRLYCDLLLDGLAALPQAWRNTYAVASAPSLVVTAESTPTFVLLHKEPVSNSYRERTVVRCIFSIGFDDEPPDPFSILFDLEPAISDRTCHGASERGPTSLE